MISIEQLRYVRLGTRDLPAAIDFAQRILGLQLIERSEHQAFFRSDDRDHTLVYFVGEPNDQAVGLEVRSGEALAEAAASLHAHGYAVEQGTADAAAQRKVKSFIAFRDASGNRIELVLRPLNSGWRYHAPRDAGVTGLAGVALRSRAIAADENLWTRILGGKVSDWVGDAAYVSLAAAHHRIALHPSNHAGVLAVEYGVEGVDQIMQAQYFMQNAQVRVAHGPGRRPSSGQLFITFAGPDGVLFSFVAEGEPSGAQRLPRQFARKAGSFCSWGSESQVPEFSGEPV